MIIYHYDRETGIYSGEGVADESPLEPGVYLIPACSTKQKPPVTGYDTIAIFNGDAWIVAKVEDSRAPFERAWRDSELNRSDKEINKIQDGQNSSYTVNSWRKYRVALRGWPEDERFPDSQFRPSAPDKPRK